MTYYLISDTHFNHQMLVNRGYRIEGYERTIYDSFSVLNEDDVLIHLGDVCIGGEKEVHENIIKKLPCKKWLMRGNHDNKTTYWYLKHGWDFVGYSANMYLFGRVVLFSHLPQNNIQISEREWLFDVNIHGHLHTKDRYPMIKTSPYNLLISLENNFTLVALDDALRFWEKSLKGGQNAKEKRV